MFINFSIQNILIFIKDCISVHHLRLVMLHTCSLLFSFLLLLLLLLFQIVEKWRGFVIVGTQTVCKTNSSKGPKVNICTCVRDRWFLPQVLFVCTSGKEGGRGLKPWKTENLRKNLRKTCRGGVFINKIWGITLGKTGVNLSEIEQICWRLSASAWDCANLCEFARICMRLNKSF